MTKQHKKKHLDKVVVIVGPTASGKTALSLKLSKKFSGEIISADSRQIYRGMDIGTAKVSKEKMNVIKHHLIDIKNPNQDYTVAEFKKDAIKAINKIITLDKLPIIVGGTGLYISSLVNNLEIPKIKENKKLRAKIEKEIKEKGLEYVFDKLIELDPEAAYIVDPLNPRRVVRALEVATISGKPYTLQRKVGKPLFEFLEIGIIQSPEILRQRISNRISQMIKDGLVDEVKSLVSKYGYQVKVFDAIDYREIIGYLKSEISLDQAIELMTKNTWHYGKRQITWFKKDKKIHWIKNQKEAENLVAKFIKNKTMSSSLFI